MRQPLLGLVLALSTIGIGVACSATAGPGTNSNDDPNFGDDDSVGGTDADFGDDEDPGGGADSGELTADPETCAQAADFRSYVGCDFWPTVLANPVFVEFDFAVVVANGGKEASTVTVTGPAGFSREVSVAPGALETVLLPWVPELKGPEFDMPNTPNGRLQTSLAKKQGAYHLVSSTPVTVWQFSPLQYKKPAGTGEGQCGARITAALAGGSECRAASNDASLLLPSTAMTGNYRVGVYSSKHEGTDWGSVPGGFGITATADGTEVVIEVPAGCGTEAWPPGEPIGNCVVAGPNGSDIPTMKGGDQLHLTMNAGDVVELVGAWGTAPQLRHADVSGTVINATKPVQVIGFNAIAMLPDVSVGNADHLEDTILPAEVIGKEYIVTPPTAFGGAPTGHVVRIYGNVNGTKLTYPEGKPPGAPDTIDAGQVVQIPPMPTGMPAPQCAGTTGCYINEPFVVQGDQPFVVASFMLGGDLQVPGYGDSYAAPGDPSFSNLVTPAQFRTNYTFLAPADFMENYADILVPEGAEVTLDGAPLAVTPTAIGASGWGIARAPLSATGGGIHQLETTDTRGIGLQVMGFGNATSFYYPGGLNLKRISVPPVITVN